MKKLEKKLHKELGKFVKICPDAVTVTDLEGTIIQVSDMTLELFGFDSAEGLIGRNAFEFISEEDQKRALKNLKRTLKEGIVRDAEYGFIKKDGTRFIGIINSTVIKDDHNQPVAFLGIIKDITSLKDTEEKLRESRKYFQTLFNFMVDPVIIADGKGKILEVSDRIAEITGYKKSDLIGMNFMDIDTLPDKTKTILKDNLIKRMKGIKIPPYEIEAITKDKKKKFYEVNAAKFDYMGNPAVMAVFRDISERKKTQDARRESEERHRAIIENTHEIIFRLSPKGIIQYVNPRVEEIHGYKPEELIGRYLKKTTPISEMPKALKALKTVLSGKVLKNFVIDQYNSKGKIVTMEINANPIVKNGKVISAQGIMRDITERRQKDEELRKYQNQLEELVEKRTSELKLINKQLKQEISNREQIGEELKQYQFMVESAQDAIFYKDLESRYLLANPKILDFLGLSLEQVIGKNDRELFKDQEEAKKNIEDDRFVFKTKKPLERIKRMTGKGEKACWFHTIKVPHIDSKGEIKGLIGIARDITALKLAQEKLNKEREYYRSLIESMSDWVWEMDKKGIHTYSNPAIENILGYKVEDVIGHPVTDMWVESAKTPESIKRLKKTLASGKGWKDFQCKFRHKDGSERYMESTAVTIFDSQNQLTGYRGVDRDITERKRMEQALRDSRESFHNIVERTTDGFVIVDKKGTVRFVNLAFTSMFGKKSDEFTGKLFGLPIVADTTTEVDLIRNGHTSGVAEMRVSETEWGGEKAYLASLRDISIRKKIEDEVKGLNEVLELINTILRHDIMNQLTVVKGRCQMLQVKTKEEQLLTPVFKAIKRCVDLINGMRDLESVVSSGKALKTYNVRETIEKITQGYSVDFDLKGNCKVMADEALDSVFTNIIRNAIMHGKTDRIEINIAKKRELCEIKIADYGVGIPDEIKDKIFNEGFKYGDSGQSGLGLYIVKKIIDRYNGQITVEDNKPNGGVFIIRLRRSKNKKIK